MRTRQVFKLESLESRNLMTAGVAPTAEAQYMLELVNLVRTNPAQAAQRLKSNVSLETQDTLDYYGVNLDQVTQDLANSQVRQPLAWNDHLAAAATTQSRDMATKGFQSHQGSDGSWPDDRMQRAGYTDRTKSAENAFAYAESVDQAMQAFAYDWGVPDRGHLRNLTEPGSSADNTFKETGIGIVNSQLPGFGKVITEDFGLRSDSPTYLLGVAYNDNNHDNFYEPGEGQGGVEIDATDAQGRTQVTYSADPGGYQIPLTPGHYKITAKVDGQTVSSQGVDIGSQNIKLDFLLNNLPKPAPTPTPTSTPTTPSTGTTSTSIPTGTGAPQGQVVTPPSNGGGTNSSPTSTDAGGSATGSDRDATATSGDDAGSSGGSTEVVMFNDDFFNSLVFDNVPVK
jgi:uncharacterized protein YkwD